MVRRRNPPGRGALQFLLLAVAGGLILGLILARSTGSLRAVRSPSGLTSSPVTPSSDSTPGARLPAPLPVPRGGPSAPPPPAGVNPVPVVPPADVQPPAGRVSVIFDDAGGSLEDLEAIISLGRPVTIAVLPGLRFSRDVAERARAAGLEVFLHLPLEADDSAKAMGPGGIATAMSDEEIAATVRAGLASVPGAVGVNNHMGSRASADERVMRAVLGEVKRSGLIWVDSRTTTKTVGARLAAELGIPAASRQVFLDNTDDPQAIRTQITRLIQAARTSGQAIAIGHAHRQTAQVLREMLGEFDRLGIEFVPASVLAR